MALKRYGPLKPETASQYRVHVRPINQLLNRVFDDIALKVAESKLATDWLKQRTHVVQLMPR